MNKFYSSILKKVDENFVEPKTKKIESKIEELDFDLDLNENNQIVENIELDLDIEEIEPEEKVEQLFDGYLGEKNFAPNPLEYGPNAMYRQNGTVYRKSVDNLWEAYLKDGAQGPKGSAGGSGVGVQEVEKIVNQILSSTPSSNLTTFPSSGRIAVLGTSTVTRCITTVSGTNTVLETENSIWGILNSRLGNRYDFDYYGYAGQDNSVLKARLLDTVIPTNPKTIILHLSYNDIDDTISSSLSAFESAKEIVNICISNGILPVVVTPHLQIDVAGKWGPTNLYNKNMMFWCKQNGIICISGLVAIASNTDKTGTAKPSAMADTLHIASEGAFYYVQQGLQIISANSYPTLQFTGAGNSELSAFLHANPHMTGSGAPGTGVSGIRPSNITAQRSTGSGTASGTSGSDHEGSYYDFTISATTSADVFKIVESITSARWNDTKNYVVISDIEILNNNCVNAIRHRLILSPEITLFTNATRTLNVPNGRYYEVSKSFASSEYIKSSSNESGLYIYCGSSGTCTIRIRYMNVIEL